MAVGQGINKRALTREREHQKIDCLVQRYNFTNKSDTYV